MRHGMNVLLEQRTRRVDGTGRNMIEAQVVPAGQVDMRQRIDQWQAADSITGLAFTDDGGVRPTGSAATIVQSITMNGYVTDLDRAFPMFAGMLQFGGTDSADLELRRIQAWLHPRQNGANPKTVAYWQLEAYNLAQFRQLTPDGHPQLVLRQAADPVRVTAAGDGEGYVLFDFSTTPHGVGPRPKRFGAPEIRDPSAVSVFNPPQGSALYVPPTLFLFVFGFKADGTAATNVALAFDTTVASVTSAGNLLTGRAFVAPYTVAGYTLGGYGDNGASSTPRMIIETGAYVAATVQFSTGGNQMTLPAVPTNDVEFTGTADVPDGCVATFQVLKDGGNPAVGGDWVTFLSGQKSTDLANVSKRATYQMRMVLTPNAAGNLAPTGRSLGVREIKTTDLSYVARITDVAWSVDPITMKAEVSQCTMSALRDGVRDYADAITALLATTDIGSITIRVYWGDGNLPRTSWLHQDDFLIDGTKPMGPECQLVLVSPLELLLDFIPKYQAGSVAAPASDQSVGTWTTDSGGGANLYQRINEASFDDTSFIQSVLDPANAAYETKLAVAADPTGRAHYVDFRYRKSVAGGKTIDLTVQLKQGATVIASVVLANIGSDWTSGTLQLVDSQILAITNYADLRINFSANETGAGAAERGQVSWTQLRLGAKRVAPAYVNQSLQAVFNDLINNQIGVDARYRGPVIANTTDLVSRNLGDVDPQTPLGKGAVDNLMLIGGCALIPSQGRLKVVDMFAPQRVVAIFPSEELKVVSAGPGYEQRVPEYFVPVRWNAAKQKFEDEVRTFHGPALLALGRARIDPPRTLEDDAAKWIQDDALGSKVGTRMVQALGPGLLLWEFVSTYRWPELEPGDVVAVQTDKFVAKDPNSARALAGYLWAIGVIQRVHDSQGRHFTAWIRNYSDIGTTNEVASRLGFVGPDVQVAVEPVFGQPALARLRIRAVPEVSTIHYTILNTSDVVPDPSADPAIWLTYTASLLVARDPSINRKIVAWADNAGFWGPQRSAELGADLTATIFQVTGSQSGAGPNYNVAFAASVDADTRRIRWYQKKNGWPTLSGTANGVLDETTGATKSIHERSVYADGGGVDLSNGAALAGGLSDATPFTAITTDTVYCIAVPIDSNGVLGPRFTTTYQPVAAPPALLTFTTVRQVDGTACSGVNAAKNRVSWTNNANVLNTDRISIYENPNGFGETLVYGPADPTAPLLIDILQPTKFKAGGTNWTWQYRYELKRGANLVDSGQTTLQWAVDPMCPQ